MIVFSNVSKRFGAARALRQVSLELEPGKIYGLLGRNGAGKSTLMNILTNRIFADEGNVTVDGDRAEENESAQRKLYLMSEKTLLPANMCVEEVMRWTARFYPDFDMTYAAELSRLFGLDTGKNVRSLSTGYASIVKCILALAVHTPYVLLDEPVLGLDANHRDLFYRVLMERYAREPFCCVISSHLIDEISTIAEKIIIIHRGEVLCAADREALLAENCLISGPAAAVDACTAGLHIWSREDLGGLCCVCVRGCPEELPESVTAEPVDLQNLFIRMTCE